MNATEARYAARLEAERLAGEVLAWHFEALTLRLPGGTRWTPDFLVRRADQVELVDVKGGPRKLDQPAQRVKAREVAAMVEPLGWRVVVARWVDGEWRLEVIASTTAVSEGPAEPRGIGAPAISRAGSSATPGAAR